MMNSKSGVVLSLLCATPLVVGVGSAGGLIDGFVETEKISPAAGWGCFTQLRFLPDGRALALTKEGTVLIADPAANGGHGSLATEVYLVLDDVHDGGETGALSLLVDPTDWAAGEQLVYICK